MQLIQNGTQGGTTVPAKYYATGTPGYANSGAPGTVTPTINDPDVVNTLLAELANVVTASGLTLDPTNNAQVLAAIRAMIAGRYTWNAASPPSSDVTLNPGEKAIITFSGVSSLPLKIAIPSGTRAIYRILLCVDSSQTASFDINLWPNNLTGPLNSYTGYTFGYTSNQPASGAVNSVIAGWNGSSGAISGTAGAASALVFQKQNNNGNATEAPFSWDSGEGLAGDTATTTQPPQIIQAVVVASNGNYNYGAHIGANVNGSFNGAGQWVGANTWSSLGTLRCDETTTTNITGTVIIERLA